METSHYYPLKFPDGTTVGAYLRSDWPVPTQHPTGPPPGEPITTTVIPEGHEFTLDLEWEYRYFLGAEVEGEWRYVSVAPLLEAEPFYWLPRELKEMIDKLDDRLTVLEES